MSSTPDRLNRTIFAILGFILLTAGLYGLLRSYGVFGDTQAQESPLTSAITGYFARIDDFFWPLVAVAMLVIAYLAYRWLKAQLTGKPRVSEVDLTRDPAEGRTTLSASGAASALARDLQSDSSVRSAGVRMVQDGASPELDVHMEVAEDTDVEGLTRRVEDGPLQRFAQAIEAQAVLTHLHIGLGEPMGRRVL